MDRPSRTRVFARWATFIVVGVLLIATLAAVFVGYWFSGLGQRRAAVEGYLSQRLGVPVSIGTIVPGWRGIAPQIKAMDVAIGSARRGPPALTLDELDLTLEPLSLLMAEPTIRELALLGPRLELERTVDGRIRLAQIDRLGAGEDNQGWRALLRHRELRIDRGTLVWKDYLADEAPLVFSSVALTARRRGSGFAVSASVTPPVSVGGELRLEAELAGIADGGDWSAHVALNAQGVDLVQLPAIVSERLPFSAGGFVDLQGWLQWRNGALTSGFAGMDVSQPSALTGGALQLLAAARSLHADVAWHRTEGGWALQLEPVRVRPWGARGESADRPWLRGPVEVEHGAKGTRIRVPRLSLDLLDKLFAGEDSGGLPERIRELRPTGELRDLDIELVDGFHLASYAADVHALGIRHGVNTPGLAGIDGHLSGDLDRGRLELDSSAVQLDYPRVFRDVLDITRLGGVVQWQRRPDGEAGIQITGERIQVVTPDVKATGSLHVDTSGAPGVAPFVHASGEFSDGDGARTSRYLPAGIMPPKAVRWLDRAIVGGTVPSGSFVYSGRTDRFPFRDGDGRFRVSFQVRDGVLDYEPGWPRLESADAVLTFEGASMRVEGASGKIAGLTLDSGHAGIADLKTPQPVLELEGNLSGGFGPVIDFLRNGPIADDIGLDSVAVSGHGRGSTELALSIPIKAAHTSTVNGVYHFEEAALHFSSGIEIGDLRGELSYSRDGVSGKSIKGSMLGGPVTIDVSTEQPGPSPRIALVARGHAQGAALEPVLGAKLTASLDGDADWRGHMRIERGAAHLEVESSLEGVAVSLPAPIAKPAAAARPLRVDIRYGGAAAGGERAAAERSQVTRFQIGEGLSGVLAFVDREGWKPHRGQIVLGGGQAALPDADGIVLQVVLPGLELDPWLEFLQRQDEAGASGGNDTQGDGGFRLRRVDASVDALTWLGRSFDDVQAALVRDADDVWSGTLVGARVQGHIEIAPAARGQSVTARLQRLYWPLADDREPAESAPSPGSARAPASLPALDVQASAFRFGVMRLGQLVLAGAPRGGDWVLDKLTLTQPALVVAGSGAWSTEAGATRTQVELSAQSNDLGAALSALDIHQVKGGKATATAKLSWAGGFDALSWQRLEGSYELSASDGRFIKVEPGVGRVFGLFNTESLTRRLRLDFSDLYSKGFSFDRIESTGTIGDGHLRLVQYYISGPAALVELQGVVGLVARDYDLTMTVVPEVGGNLSILGGVLGGPAAGALIYLAQKVFEHQLADMVHYRYSISGTWDSPQVKRIGGPGSEQHPERIGERSSPESLTGQRRQDNGG